METEKKLLLVGFDTLPDVLAVRDAVAPFGADVMPVPKTDGGKTVAVLCGLEEDINPSPEMIVPGRMAILCGLDNQLEEIIPALRKTPAGSGCLKAIVTPHNRFWTVARLYGQLLREHQAQGK